VEEDASAAKNSQVTGGLNMSGIKSGIGLNIARSAEKLA
jgi:hypothetical protein